MDKIDEEIMRVRKTSNQVILILLLCMGSGLIISCLYAMQSVNAGTFLTITGVAMATAGAAAFSGALLGFLFGIPRSLQGNGSQATDNETASKGDQKGIGYHQNTNLEQISDWLTKILVGVGLTQLAAIPSTLQKFADFIAPGLGNFSNSRLFAVALLIYFLICGFLIAYLWTRLYMAGAFRQADLEAMGAEINDYKVRQNNDNKAMIMVQRQLQPGRDDKPFTQEEINEIIRNTSNETRAQVYFKAEGFRHENWKTDKAKAERTIMIFRGLIENDISHVYFRNHGQLAFALMDQATPNLPEAIAEFTKAIDKRPLADKKEWLDFEGYRAICRIKCDSDFLAKPPARSAAQARNEIIADLKEAARGTNSQVFHDDPDVQGWLTVNGIKWEDLPNL